MYVKLVATANVRGDGDGVWVKCGWLKNGILIWGERLMGITGVSKWGRGKMKLSTVVYICVVNQV